MTKPPHRFFVTCPKGLEEVVAAELRAEAIGASDVAPGSSGVYCSGSLATGYRANLWLRSGIRVLMEYARQRVVGPEELYEWARTLDWSGLLRGEQTFSVESRVWDSELTHSKFAAMRVKDALCDHFREKTGQRPNVDVQTADLPLFLYVYRDEAILYRDMSGVTLHKRGYRDVMHKSSLNECLAAGLLLLSGWDGRSVLCDPMCGSGTFAIEGALLALRRAPGLLRKPGAFPFERWPDFEKALWKDCKSRAHAQALFELPFTICVNDHHEGALSLARKDAQTVGVDSFIHFSQSDVASYEPPEPPKLITVNPPWGERLKPADLAEPWKKLDQFFNRYGAGAEAWIWTGNLEVSRLLDRKPVQDVEIRNGKLVCHALKYCL